MQRVKRSTAVAVQPAPPAGGTPGFFAQPNPQGGVPATVPGFEWYNNVQEELVGLVLAAGLALADNDPTQLVQAIVKKGLQGSYFNIGTAGGTADAITATYTPKIAALSNGMTLYVRAGSANATTTPTFTPNSGTIVAKTIVKGNGLALVAGDIAGAGHWVELQYDATLDKWVLLNPASCLGKQTSSVQSFNSGAVNLAFNSNTVTSMTANVVMPSYSSTGKFRIIGRLTTNTTYSSASGSYIFNSGLLDTTNSNAQLQGDGKSKYQGSGQGTVDTCVFFSSYLYAPGATIPLTVQFSANAAGTLNSQQLTVLVVEG